mmetsp:Transcript_59660/g.168087  ORF Transcript_59660/g.168087 Transcript_59660/m.168087 type:complete len:206 (-) Transcript_59660:296-913(-)
MCWWQRPYYSLSESPPSDGAASPRGSTKDLLQWGQRTVLSESLLLSPFSAFGSRYQAHAGATTAQSARFTAHSARWRCDRVASSPMPSVALVKQASQARPMRSPKASRSARSPISTPRCSSLIRSAMQSTTRMPAKARPENAKDMNSRAVMRLPWARPLLPVRSQKNHCPQKRTHHPMVRARVRLITPKSLDNSLRSPCGRLMYL